MSQKRVLIGEIATAHGIKGLVKLRSFADDEKILQSVPLFTSETGQQTLKLRLKNPLKNDWLAEVEGVSDRNAAEELRGTMLYIDRDQLPEPEEGEYYIEDMIGLKVVDNQGNDIGSVLAIENFGASDLIDIKPSVGGQSFYLPYTDETVLDVDMEDRKIVIEIPAGLLD
jgi:16S rRNA processing protein RimM